MHNLCAYFTGLVGTGYHSLPHVGLEVMGNVLP